MLFEGIAMPYQFMLGSYPSTNWLCLEAFSAALRVEGYEQ